MAAVGSIQTKTGAPFGSLSLPPLIKAAKVTAVTVLALGVNPKGQPDLPCARGAIQIQRAAAGAACCMPPGSLKTGAGPLSAGQAGGASAAVAAVANSGIAKSEKTKPSIHDLVSRKAGIKEPLFAFKPTEAVVVYEAFTLKTFVYTHFLTHCRKIDVETSSFTKQALFAREIRCPFTIKITFCKEETSKKGGEVLLVKCKGKNGKRAFIEMGEQEPGHFYVVMHEICLKSGESGKSGKFEMEPMGSQFVFNSYENAYLQTKEFRQIQQIFKGRHPYFQICFT